MIALKREVAADIYLPYGGRFFRGANALFTKLATSHCTIENVHQRWKQRVVQVILRGRMEENRTHTEKCTVTACRT